MFILWSRDLAVAAFLLTPLAKDLTLLKLVVDHSGKERRIGGLYLITDQGERLVERVREALASGGVSVLQYRDKVRGPEDRLDLGGELKLLCSQFQVKFIINDDLELAIALDADGLHLGQDDGDPAAARAALGAKKIIGVSTHSLEEALPLIRDQIEPADAPLLAAMVNHEFQQDKIL